MAFTDWATPVLTSFYQDVLDYFKSRDESIAKMDFAGQSNVPTNFKRYTQGGTEKFQFWNGSAWVDLQFHADITAEIAAAVAASIIPTATVIWRASASAPTGYLQCNGAAVSETTYAQLFAEIGYTFGNPGGGNFNLPDIQRKHVLGKAASGGQSTVGDAGGSFDHDHSTPNHTHSFNDHVHSMSHDHGFSVPGLNIPGHTHTIPKHRHDSKAAGATINVTSSGEDHFHQVAATNTTGATFASKRGNVFSLMRSSVANDSEGRTDFDPSGGGGFNSNDAKHTHGNAAFSGFVGVSAGFGGQDGDVDFSTTGQSGGTSTDPSGSLTTGGSSAANTGSGGAGTTNGGEGGGTTGTANAPYIVLFPMIKIGPTDG